MLHWRKVGMKSNAKPTSLTALLGLQRTKQTGNFVAAFVSAAPEPLTTHDGQRIRQAEISA